MLGADPMVPQPWLVRRVRRETHDVRTLELQPTASPCSFAPGQFNMLYVFGVGEVPISMSGAALNGSTLVHTVRAVGAVSRAITVLRRGDIIGVRGPFGSCWPLEQSQGRDLVIIAGGIGLAPLRPALYSIFHARKNYQRVWLFYGARTPKDLLFVNQLEKWRGRFDVTVEITVDAAPTDWRGHVGVVTTFIPRAEFDAHKATAMLCGPEVMMRFAIRELQKRGVPDEKIFVSVERNMKCATGFCGHCQFGPNFICKNGPVFSYDAIRHWFETREI